MSGRKSRDILKQVDAELCNMNAERSRLFISQLLNLIRQHLPTVPVECEEMVDAIDQDE